MPSFAQLNPKTQLIEIIDMESGKILCVQKDAYPLLNGETELLVDKVMPDGSVVRVQVGIPPEALALSAPQPFSQITVDLICQKIAEGGSITNVCKQPGFPSYNVLCQWRKQRPEIEKQLERAREDRAEYLRDMVLCEAERAESTKDPINASTLRVEAYKWAAGVDSAKYSPKAKLEAHINTPMQLIVHTGINREVKEVEYGTHQSKAEVAATLPNSAGSAALPSPSVEQPKAPLEVHPISSAPAKPGNDLAGG